MRETADFYSALAPVFHLVYPDWEATIERQAAELDALIREQWGDAGRRLLDAACGVGTQTLGLAGRGYSVTASDISGAAVERARREAGQRGLSIDFSVADMREVAGRCTQPFDVVIACDNAVPHLLSDADILEAFRQFFRCLRPGGGCIVSVRDYEQENLSKQQVRPFGVREADGARWLVGQVWDPHPPFYDLTMYFVEDRGEPDCRARAMRSTYYAVGTSMLVDLMTAAGFANARRVDGRYFQPLIIGTRPRTAEAA
jgi:SAM-dependent methyltransferase